MRQLTQLARPADRQTRVECQLPQQLLTSIGDIEQKAPAPARATPVYGESGPGSILSLAANVTASLQPQTALFLSFALCAVSAEGVQVFVSTSAAFSSPSSADLDPADFDVNGRPRWTSDPDKGVWFIDLAGGYGTWQGGLGANGDGLWIAIRSDNQSVNGDIEVGLSKAGFIQDYFDEPPVLGDTTASHLLVRTPPFANLSAPFPVRQAYPNYTLPPPTYDPPRPSGVESTVYILPTDLLDGDVAWRMRRSACWVRRTALALSPAFIVADRRIDLAPLGRGWRETLVLTRDPLYPHTLAAGQNYTLFVLTPSLDGDLLSAHLDPHSIGTLSGPIWARMKRADFPCPLAYALDLCPAVAHAVALPLPPSPGSGGLLTSLPQTLTDQLGGYLGSFAISLGTWPCGRAEDRYSFVADCEDCWTAYRDWLCAISLPRCGEAPDADSDPVMAAAAEDYEETDVPPLLPRSPAAPRSPSLTLEGTLPSYAYSELLPCLGLCYHVDRLCPVFLGFRCPIATGGRDGRGTARRSYAVGSGPMGIAESRAKEGVDRFGVAWCERGGEWIQ